MIFYLGKNIHLNKLTMCNISSFYDVCHFNHVISNMTIYTINSFSFPFSVIEKMSLP